MYGETFYGRHTAQHQLQWSNLQAVRTTTFWAMIEAEGEVGYP